MKMKKVGRLLSLVVAGAMALSMIPAAFAADDATYHTEYVPETSTTHAIYRHYTDGTDMYVGSDDCHWENGQCKECKQNCEHVNQSPVDNGDGTCSYVCDTCHTVIDTMEHIFQNGACVRCNHPEPTCEHEHQHPVDNGDGTCSYVCDNKDCNAVIDTMEHIFQNGACVRCNHPEPVCEHVNQTAKDNGDGTCSYVCDNCHTVIDTQPHIYYDGETACARCGAVCEHVNQTAKDNGDGTCSYVCKDCNTVIDTQAHVYYNGETACARCGAVCEHVNQTAKDNGDGTCSYVCDNCHTVIDTQPHIYYDGETACARCGAVCEHVNQTAKDNGDGTCSYVCDTCHTVIDTMAHVYYEGETACARCGFVCDHMGQKFEFSANNDDTHNVLCADCKTVVSENVPCTYIDGKCQQCGAVCQHVKQHAVDNEDGTCSYVCDKCNTVIDTVAHIYYDGEDTCARCGADKAACKHLNENYEYVDNGNGTHNVVCADCGAVAQENVACDYILDECVHCGGLYAGGNVPFFVSTGKGLLRSLRSFFMSLFIR